MLYWFDTIFPRRALFQEDRRLLHLFIGRMLASTGFSIVIPFLSLYLHGERGVPMSLVGGLFFVAALTGAMGQIVGGELTDRLGRKVVLVGTQFTRAASFLGLGAAVLLHAPLYWFAIFTSVSAFAGRAFEPPSGAMVADIAEGGKRAEYYAVLRVGGNLGWALGPAIGGFLAALSYPSLFLISAGVLLLSGLFMAIMVQETSPHRLARAAENRGASTILPSSPGYTPIPRFRLSDLGKTLRDESFLRYCWTSLLLFTVMAQLISTLSVYSVQWVGISKVQLGALYSLNGLMVVFLQFPVVRALARFRMTTALVAGSVLYAIGYATMGIGHGIQALTIAMFIVTLGEIVTTPASMNLVANFSGEGQRGRYMGVYGLFNSFGWSIGPLVGGLLLDFAAGRPMVLWAPIAFLTLIAAWAYWDLRRRIDRNMDLNYETATETATA